MNALVRAEARKIVSTRSTLVVAGFVLLYPALSLLPVLFAAEKPGVDGATIFDVVRGGAGVLTLAALLLASVAVAGEYRHGTIVPTLLVAPRRGRFLAAKLGAQVAFAAVLGLGVSAVALVVGTAYLATRDVSVDVLSGDVLVTTTATILVATLYAIVGASLGGVVKNQTAAVAGALIWVFVVENALPLVLREPGLKRWLPGGLSDRLLHIADSGAGMGGAWLALASFVGIGVVLGGVATVATRRADIQ
jgi:ABC-2 type transport system permease protein